MKHSTGEKIICSGKKCKIIATKLIPYRPNNDVFGRSELYPENDYLIIILQEIKDSNEIYLGVLDVLETQIEDSKW